MNAENRISDSPMYKAIKPVFNFCNIWTNICLGHFDKNTWKVFRKVGRFIFLLWMQHIQISVLKFGLKLFFENALQTQQQRCTLQRCDGTTETIQYVFHWATRFLPYDSWSNFIRGASYCIHSCIVFGDIDILKERKQRIHFEHSLFWFTCVYFCLFYSL